MDEEACFFEVGWDGGVGLVFTEHDEDECAGEQGRDDEGVGAAAGVFFVGHAFGELGAGGEVGEVECGLDGEDDVEEDEAADDHAEWEPGLEFGFGDDDLP